MAKVTLARNCGNGIVEHLIFGDKYQAHNFYNSFCGRVAGVVSCEEITYIGTGEYKDENCTYCPLESICLCPNRLYKNNGENEYVKVIQTDFSKFPDDEGRVKVLNL